jgi:hypothetical protein
MVLNNKLIPLRIYGMYGVTGKKQWVLVSFGDVTLNAGYYINYTDGAYKDYAPTCGTEKYIAVEPGATYKLVYNGSVTGFDCNMCFYDADKVYTFDGDSSSSDYTVKGGTYSILKKVPPITFTVPDGCYYMRFMCGAHTSITDWELYKLKEAIA